jgi:hypothetical protein
MTGDPNEASRMMRVPQGILLAASDIGRDDFERIEPADATSMLTTGMFPLVEDVAHWHIVPREGTPMSLVLPLPGASGITVQKYRQLTTGRDSPTLQQARGEMREQAAHQARLVLTGGMLMSYLTTWALWAEHHDVGGKFLVTASKVAELRGFPLHDRGKASYGKHMSLFKRDIETLISCGICSISEIRTKSIEPLIKLYEVVRGGKYYRHAPLLVDTIMLKAGDAAGFAQVPLRAMRLGAHDARAVIGLAALWRRSAASEPWLGSLEELAVELGVFRESARRSGGRAYWRDLADNLARVTSEGGLGGLWLKGTDPGAQTPIVLTPSAEMASAYQRLREARERARMKAEVVAQEVTVRRLLPSRRRRRG